MRLKLLLIPAILFFHLSLSQANPVHFNNLRGFYSDFPEIKKRRCQNCHSSKGLRLNPFGQDFAKLRSDFSSRDELFMALEQLDSDQDGIINADEILEGTHPGDPKK